MGPGDGFAGPYVLDQNLYCAPGQDPYCSTPPQQMPSVLWDLVHSTHHRNSAQSAFITSHDELDDGAV
eukprot:10906472-Prorocentrum_lima.AAC.1